jgi:hypothetical protein
MWEDEAPVSNVDCRIGRQEGKRIPNDFKTSELFKQMQAQIREIMA